jgi:two-component system copper resistance phosphate regulon response regulator CusR
VNQTAERPFDVRQGPPQRGRVVAFAERTPAQSSRLNLTAVEPEHDDSVIHGPNAFGQNRRMRVLVIEDEVRLADYLRKGLTESGYVVDIVHDGIDGLHFAAEGTYDLVVLDVMLPGKDGFEVLSELRKRRNTPVLMLTARDAVEDRVKGLTQGADDYLVKPFSFSELLARVQALLRRGGNAREASPGPSLGIADLELDLVRRRANRAGRRLDLTPKEFNLLALLLRRRGEVLSRTVLAEQVWDINFDSDTNVVDVAVRRLRSKLDEPFTTKLLHTVRGVGYVLDERDE